VDVGLMVMAHALDAEMTARAGPKHAKIPGHSANPHGSTDGPVALGGREVTVTRPEAGRSSVRRVELDAWQAFS
jgi:hypothetical protein